MISTFQAPICDRQQHVFLESSANTYEYVQNQRLIADAFLSYRKEHGSEQRRSMAADLKIADIDQRFRYRVGWPRLVHAPVETVLLSLGPVNDPLPGVDMERLRAEVRQILDRHKIVLHSGSFPQLQYRAPLQHLNKPHRNHLRFVAECEYDPRQQADCPDSWAQAVIEIHNLLRQTTSHRSLDIGIELFDPSYEDSILLTELPDTYQHIIADWDGGPHYRQQVLRLFENRPRLWQAMLLLGLQASNKHTKDHKCVLWIDAIDTTHPLWPQIEIEIRAILPQDISIEIWQASNRLLCNSYWLGEGDPILDSGDIAPSKRHHNDITPNDFEQPSNPGCSIGVVGEERGTGTLGGYVKVLQNTVDADGISTLCERVYALTCAHVALRGSPLFQNLKSKGHVRYGKDGPVLMQSPSVEDCTLFRAEVESNIANCESNIVTFDNKMALRQSENDIQSVERFRHLKDMTESSLTVLKRNLELVHRDHYLGRVTDAGFGKRENDKLQDNLCMDIALIDVTKMKVKPEDCQFNGKWPFGRRDGDLFDTWETVNLSRRLALKETVAKIGRTSGVTTGSLHNIQGDIDIVLGDEKHKSLAVYVVHYASKMDYFALPGDSGCFIFAKAFSSADTDTNKHRVIGLLIGATRNGNLGYFIPFDAIIDEIETLTGGTVIWPVRCD